MNAVGAATVGAVAIGRNEGERLRRCLASLSGTVSKIVYVDSDSSDDSVDIARSFDAEVVQLDLSLPFTAARARNTGFEALLALDPDIEYVHFVDGDCEVCAGWMGQATETIRTAPDLAIVWGRRFERYPERTIYNWLTDLEWRWSWPFGEVRLCGGDALIRVRALQEIEGFDPSLIAGEEPEMCFRLRQAGWKIFRLDAEMTLHDADMTRFSQWWKRGLRAGHAYAEGASLHGRSEERYCVREVRSLLFWGLLVPVAAIAGAWWTQGWSLLLLAGYPVLALRIYRYVHGLGATRKDAWGYAAACVVEKFPGALGVLKYRIGRLLGKRSLIIEYK